jgi:peptide/nickel transport system permease protein
VSAVAPVASRTGSRVARRLYATARWSRANPVTASGFVIILGLIATALLAPIVAPYGPYELDETNVLAPPSHSHFFGTGNFGEDIFSRVLFGARWDLLIGFSAVAIGLVLGCTLGALAGFLGDPLDELIMRVMDIVSAFPGFILAMGIAGALGPSLRNLVIAIALVNVPIYARLMRQSFLVVKRSQYATAAIGIGAHPLRILTWHLLPNTWTPIFVQSTLQFGYAILDAAGLSFIGLGVRLPTPEWGVMVSLGIERIVSGEWWVSFFPGLAIAVAVMGFNLIGDGLRDLLDPRRR